MRVECFPLHQTARDQTTALCWEIIGPKFLVRRRRLFAPGPQWVISKAVLGQILRTKIIPHVIESRKTLTLYLHYRSLLE